MPRVFFVIEVFYCCSKDFFIAGSTGISIVSSASSMWVIWLANSLSL